MRRIGQRNGYSDNWHSMIWTCRGARSTTGCNGSSRCCSRSTRRSASGIGRAASIRPPRPDGWFSLFLLGAEACGVLEVDRYSGYKAMTPVKNGLLLLAFCWAHVRRDFVGVGKSWSELAAWALEWLLENRAVCPSHRETPRCRA